ncbi:MAG: type I 3-dehydroquinate dehydratase [Nitrososphaerota archaeon]|nr:type I 3-dehydroquinate dehydratase [Nitrososphaerota archaeon]MDG7006383.1 type I 3-dehydroquinate dehydratase [Nitrososphaerota archaeon]MDG7021291.1 type I 3-dehydroquinate dehydratase [Nitrososphaerota archaeon]
MGKNARSRVCASIGAPSPREMGLKARRALKLGADLVELRVDSLSDGAPAAASSLVEGLAEVAVVTVRSAREGGRFGGSEEDRLSLISRLADLRPAYLDVELSTAKENPGWLASLPRRVPLIVSWHDFQGTPGLPVLRKTCEEERGLGSIAKVVTTATRVEDNLRTVALCRENGGRAVSFCMGELGVVSRVLTIGAAPLVYASLPNEAVAPGQLSIPAMLEFRGLLQGVD